MTEKSHIEEFNNLNFQKEYYFGDDTKEDEMWGSFKHRTNGSNEKCTQNFSPKPEEKKSFRKCISRLEDMVRMDLKEVWREHGAWIQLVQNRPSCRLLRKG
jgi:hypothetical protein